MATLLFLWSGAALAQDPKRPPDTTVYELTENAKFITAKQPRESAVSQMMGFANLGTPLCPSWIAGIAPGLTMCTINVTGSDTVNLITGLGPISGRFTVVLPVPGDVDAPEVVVMRGNFRGKMDFSQARTFGFGTVTGTVTSDRGDAAHFFGVFVLPLNGSLFGLPDPAYMGYDTVGDVATPDPTRIRLVRPNERSLGIPTARFDIYFQ